jgi:iron complex outermembrane recepter protein
MADSTRMSLVLGNIFLAFALAPAVVFAQSTARGGAPLIDTSAAGGSAATASPDALEEITVTARRKSERLSDVPLTVNVKSSEVLADSNIVMLRELSQVTPGLNFTFIGAAAQPTVRGISSESTGAGAENSISIYVDGVYQPNQYGNSFDLPDVDRVEVLKGPQGTLFGRNSMGGAVLVYTRGPQFTPTGSFEVSDGLFNGGGNEVRVKGFYAAPINDVIAYSVSAQYAKNDGYFHNVIDGGRAGGILDKNVRAKLLFKPNDSFNVLISAYYDERNDYSVFAEQNIHSPFPGSQTKPYNVANDARGFDYTKSYGANVRAELETAAGTLSSLSSYSTVRPYVIADADGTAVPAIVYTLRQPGVTVQQELTLASHYTGPFNYVAGAFGYKGTESFKPLEVSGTVGGPAFYNIDSESIATAFAGFGEATFKATDALSFVGGVRFSEEHRVYNAAFVFSDPLPPIGRATFNAWTPRASVRYAFTPDNNVYFTFSEGFKSGLFDGSSLSNVPVNPEKINSYEVGFKTLPHPNVQVNGAAFLYNVHNLQTQTNTAGGLDVLANAGAAKIEGLEFETNWRVTQEFKLGVNGAFIPTAKYIDYPVGAFVEPLPGGGGANSTADFSGTRLAKTPKWQANILADYQTQLSIGKVGANANLGYTSTFYYELSQFLTQKQYALLNGNVFWSPTDSHFKYTIWGKNLTNKVTYNNYLANATGFVVAYQPPRELGVSVGYSF